MIDRPDVDGKYPLSGREYYSIRELFGMISALEYTMDDLKARAQLTPGTWRDMCLVMSKAKKVVDELLDTIPQRKLRMIRTDIENTVISVEVRAPHGAKPPRNPDYVCVPSKALDGLLERIVDIDCFACAKRGREIKKCQMRQLIEDTFPYDIPEPDNDGCKFCNCHIDHDDLRSEEDNDAESERVC